MDFSSVVFEIIVLFIIIFIGYIMRKRKIIDTVFSKNLSTLLIKLTLPALIISSMHIELDSEIIYNIQVISLFTVVIYLLAILLANLLTKILPVPEDKKNIFIFLIVFGNVGYMGYPVLGVAYEELGIFYGLFNNIAFNVLAWTYGIYLFTSTRDNQEKESSINWKHLLNNGIIAILIGFFLLLTGLRLPSPLLGAVDHLGNMTFPLSMLIIGSSLVGVNYREIITNRYILLITLVKLLIFPGFILLLLQFISLPEIVGNVSLLLTAMPCAALSVVFAEKFDRDNQFAAQGVFTTTLLALFTIPLFLYLLG